MNAKMKTIVMSVAILVGGIFSSGARADTLFDDHTAGDSSDSLTIDLNDYSSSYVSSVYIEADGYGASQGNDEEYAEADVTFGSFYDYEHDSGLGSVRVSTSISVTGINKDGSGHWIADEVNVNGTSYYDVDLGTGEIYIASFGYGTDYGDATAYADIEY